MKALIVALAMLASTAATAQQTGRTVRLIDNATKEVVGTVFVSGRYLYLRNKQGVHYATIETNEDGTRMAYDPKGEKIDLSRIGDIK